jgi:hypothetical protein
LGALSCRFGGPVFGPKRWPPGVTTGSTTCQQVRQSVVVVMAMGVHGAPHPGSTPLEEPLPPNGTIVGKNEICHWENLVGSQPPTPPSSTSLPPSLSSRNEMGNGCLFFWPLCDGFVF